MVEYETFNFADAGSSPAGPIYEDSPNYTCGLLFFSKERCYTQAIIRKETKQMNTFRNLYLHSEYLLLSSESESGEGQFVMH